MFDVREKSRTSYISTSLDAKQGKKAFLFFQISKFPHSVSSSSILTKDLDKQDTIVY